MKKIITLTVIFLLHYLVYAQTAFTSAILRNVDSLKNIQYGEAKNIEGKYEKLFLDIYSPNNDTLKKRPLIVFIHGGGFVNGDKGSGYPLLFCKGFAQKGYVTASVNYRLGIASPQNDTTYFEAMYRGVQDAKAAIRFFRKYADTYGIDTSLIFIMGGSAGSMIVLHLAYLNQNEVPAYINTAELGTLEGESGNANYSSKVKAVINCWGAMVNYRWMNAGDLPVFNVHGNADKLVPFDSSFGFHGFRYGSKIIFERAQVLGIPTGLKAFENAGHTLDNDKVKQTTALEEIANWLYNQFFSTNKKSATSRALIDVSQAQTLVIDRSALAANKKMIAGNDVAKKTALKNLLSKADKIIKQGTLYSVMDKKITPPSGDKHDYMSQAPYWWPDSTKANGLPYIRKDGEVNPEYDLISDTKEMDYLISDVENLGLAYYYSKEEVYAGFATTLLQTWFLNEATKQNPNLNFGQGIPGTNTGRGIGIIETRGLTKLIDAAILLQGSKSWTSTNHTALKKWFADYLSWLTNSQYGKDEAAAKNNHGTYYDVQVIDFAIFTDQIDFAKKQFEVTKQRIESQLKPDGSQPEELARTKSWGYTNMNLLGYCTLAQLAKNANIDLWHFETNDKKSISKAIEWLLPYLKKEKPWQEKQIKKITYEESIAILKMAAAGLSNAAYNTLAKEVAEEKYHSAFFELAF